MGVMSLKLGSLARLHVPSHLAYGEHSSGVIPPHAGLVFEVEILCINDRIARPTPIYLLRRLLTLPPVDGLEEMGSVQSSDHRPKTTRQSAEAIASARHQAADDAAADAVADPDAAAELAATQLPMEVVKK